MKLKDTTLNKIKREAAINGLINCFNNIKDVLRCKHTCQNEKELIGILRKIKESGLTILGLKNSLGRKKLPVLYFTLKVSDKNDLPPVEFQLV